MSENEKHSKKMCTGVRILAEARNFSLLQNVHSVLGPTQLPIECVPGYFPGVNRPGHELNHSLPSRVEVKNEWSCISTLRVRLRDVDRHNFGFLSLSNFVNNKAIILPSVMTNPMRNLKEKTTSVC